MLALAYYGLRMEELSQGLSPVSGCGPSVNDGIKRANYSALIVVSQMIEQNEDLRLSNFKGDEDL